MAYRYIVASGTWDATNTAIWSATDGGAPGASVPGVGDIVLMTALSGAVTVTLGADVSCLAINQTGFTGTMAMGAYNITLLDTTTIFTGSTSCTNTGTGVIKSPTAGARIITPGAVTEANALNFEVSGASGVFTITSSQSVKSLNFTTFGGSLDNKPRTVYGNWTLSSAMTLTAGTATTTFAATSGTQVVTSNGVTLDFPITVNAPGATVQLADALTIGSTRTLTLNNGGLDLNGFNLTTGLFASTNPNVRSITSGAGQFYITGTSGTPWSTSTITNLTMVDRPTVNVTGAPTTGTRTLNLGNLAENRTPTVNISAGTATLGWDGLAYTMDFTGYAGTLSNPGTRTIYGNLTVSATMTPAAGTTATTFAATSGTQTITSNGVTMDFPITVNAPGATVQLADALTIGSTQTFTHTAGGLNLNGFNLTTGTFSSTNTNVRSITSGAGQFFCTVAASSGTSIPFNANVTTNLTFVDRPTINLTGNGSGTAIRQIYVVVGQTEALAPDVNVTAGTDTVSAPVTTNMPIRNLNFTGFSGTLSSVVRVTYGDLTLSPTMVWAAGVQTAYFSAASGTQVITSNGITFDCPFDKTGAGTVQLADALTIGSTRTFTHTAGGLDLNGKNLTAGAFNSSNTNVRSIASGLGQFYMTNVAASGTQSVVVLNTITNLTMVDRPTFNLTGAGSGTSIRTVGIGALAEAVAPDVYVTAGTDTVQVPSNSGGPTRNINFTGFSGAWANFTRTIYGSLTNSPTMTATAGTNATTFAATSGTQVITSNGVTLDFPLTVNAPGATVQLADALTIGSTRALTLTDGGFNANGFNVTAGTVAAGASFDTLTMGAGTWTVQGSGASAWSINAANTIVPGTSTVSMTSASAKTFVGAGKTYYNLNQGGAGALTITGANTFNDITNTTQPATVTLPASTTTTVSALSLAGTAGNLVTLNSSTPATRATLSKASGTVDVSYLSIKDSAATGGASFVATTSNGNIDAGNNTGWRFLVLRSFGSIIF